MKKCEIKASIDSIETLGLVDGPGIRIVVFFNKCLLRCKYCHNPEMWHKKEENYFPEELANKIKRYIPYIKKNGGVTFSGGEPLLHSKFIIEVAKILKQDNIHIALDTAGVGLDDYEELLSYIDLVILDIKHTNNDEYKKLTGLDMNKVENFIKSLNKSNKEVWIRQVIVPNLNDNVEYLDSLNKYLKRINNITNIEFLPFHRLGREKYLKLNIQYPFEDKDDMDKVKCNELYDIFLSKWKEDA